MIKLKNVIPWIQSLSLTKIILFLILLQTAIHIKYSSYPPVGFHAWRQTIGLSVARNYYEEDMNLFTPRVDSRGQHTGITGMEFPLTNYLIAITYHVFGFNNISSRYLILAFSFIAIAFCFLFFKRIFYDKFYGLCAALLMIFSPLFCYYSFAVLPEVPSLAFLLISLFYLNKWDQENKNKYITIFAIAFCLAGLMKISAIVILPYALILLLRKRKLTLPFLGSIVISLVVIAAWYLYARHLSNVHQNYDFSLAFIFPPDFNSFLETAKRVFIQWLPELYINYSEFILFVLGLFVIWKYKSQFTNLKLFFKYFALGVLLFMLVRFPLLLEHDYYMVPSLPLLIGISTIGIYFIREKISQSKYYKFWLCLSLAIIITIPILGTVRAFERFERGLKDTPHEQLTLETHLSQAIPYKDALIMITDESKSIKLYYANRKGWNIPINISVETFNDIISNGAKYLISDSRTFENRKGIRNRIHLLSSYYSFNIYEFVNEKD